MRLRIKGFALTISFPAICLFTVLIILNCDYIYCLFGITLHEAGHIAAILILKHNIKGVSISLFDIKILEKSRYKLNLKIDLIVTAAGPFINLLLFSAFYYFNTTFAWINLFIGLFNLLPAMSLDGGQLLYLILSYKLSSKASTLIIDIITTVLSIPLFFFGIVILLNSQYNFSLLFISIYLVLSLFIKEDRYL